jgi:hypothetical protein
MPDAPFTISIHSLPRDEGGWAIEAEIVFRDDSPTGHVLRRAHLALGAALQAEADRLKALRTPRD